MAQEPYIEFVAYTRSTDQLIFLRNINLSDGAEADMHATLFTDTMPEEFDEDELYCHETLSPLAPLPTTTTR